MKPKTNGISEILATKQFPAVAMNGIKKPTRRKLGTHPGLLTHGCSRKEWIMENGTHEPTRVKGEMHHRAIQKENQCAWIGDDGLDDVIERAADRDSDRQAGLIKKRKAATPDPRTEKLNKWWDEKGFDNEEKRRFGIS